MHRADLTQPELTFDPEDPPGFRSGMDRMGRRLGAQHTGASLYELPPGQALCPYHYEYAEEEWLLVLDGRVAVRTPEGTEELEPLQLVFFPRGPSGAHQVACAGDAPARVLMWSEVATPAATVYPDSDKIGIWTGNPDDDVMVRRSSKVDYYDGQG